MNYTKLITVGMILVLNSLISFSQNSLDHLNVYFQRNFEDNTLGRYLDSEFDRDWPNTPWCNRKPELQITQNSSDAENPTKAMYTYFPENSLGPEEGGTHWQTLLPSKYEEMYVSYDVQFMEGFQFQRGGKLPGIMGGDAPTTRPTGYDGFIARLMFKGDRPVFYVYYADNYLDEYGATFEWGHNHAPEEFYPSKVKLEWSSGEDCHFNTGAWHNITYRIVLNTINEDGTSNYDGILEGFFDGKLVTQLSHILFRRTTELKIEEISIALFFGGSTDSWRNPIWEWIKLDNILLYSFKNDTSVVRGNNLSSTSRRINYWRNFGGHIVENPPVDPDPEPEPEPEPNNYSADVIKVNFGYSSETVASSDWNTILKNASGSSTKLKNEKGEQTDVELNVVSEQIYASPSGSFPGIYPDNVLKSSWRADNFSTKSIQIKYLVPNQKYKFEILGSNNAEIVGTDSLKTYLNQYTVNQVKKSLCALNNTSNTISWVIQSPTGIADISWTGGTGYYGFLNSLVISKADADAPVDINIAENAQPQIQEQTFNVNETDFDAPHLGDVIASDPDQGQKLTYSIISNNDNNLFAINSQTGELTTNNENIFDYSQLEYKIIVMVEDNGSTKKSNQATITISLLPNTKVFYIDPTNTDDVAVDGTMLHPFSNWSDVTWKTGYKYLQKRNTTVKTGKISIYSNEVTLGAYGEGSDPVILSTAKDYAIQVLDKESVTIGNLHIIASDAISGIYMLGNENSNFVVQSCKIENSDYGIRVIEGQEITVKYNTFKNCLRGFYSYATENNVFYNIFRSNNDAIEIASLSSTSNIYNNVFYENNNGISSDYGDLTLYNNIFYLINEGDIALNLKLDNFLSDNNIYYPERTGFIELSDKKYNKLADYQADYNLDLNSLCQDPQFVDVYNDNFTISQYSPAINAGRLTSLSRDYIGTSVPFANFPDIGIMELTAERILLSTKEQKSENLLTIYPNPCKGQLNVDLNNLNLSENDHAIVKLLDQTGKVVLSKEINYSNGFVPELLDLSSYKNGIYFFLIEMSQKIITEKLILFN